MVKAADLRSVDWVSHGFESHLGYGKILKISFLKKDKIKWKNVKKTNVNEKNSKKTEIVIKWIFTLIILLIPNLQLMRAIVMAISKGILPVTISPLMVKKW